MSMKYTPLFLLLLTTYIHNQSYALEEIFVQPIKFTVQTAKPTFKDSSRGNADAFLDKLFASINDNADLMNLFEPLVLPDVDVGIGTVKKIQLSGIPIIRRTGFSELMFRDDKMHVQVNMGVRNLVARALYYIKGIRMRGSMKVLLKNLNVSVGMTMIGPSLKMEKFKISEISLELTEFTGFSGLNQVNKWIINNFVKTFTRVLRTQIERVVLSNVNHELKNFDVVKAITKSILTR